MKLSKADKKIFARGKSEGRRAEKKKAAGREQIERGVEAFAAWAGQKFLADRKTPYFDSIPLHYSLGGILIGLSMWGRPTETKDMGAAAGWGLVNGQLAVSGYKNQSALPGA